MFWVSSIDCKSRASGCAPLAPLAAEGPVAAIGAHAYHSRTDNTTSSATMMWSDVI
uniref:Uncharacterized protein n=1 Tax=Zea mays TaxID=4577 RepID=B4FKZ9_MAIZE|nr:unknown [Zea mays]